MTADHSRRYHCLMFGETKVIPLGDLALDRQNPRLAEHNTKSMSDEQLIDLYYKYFAVDELVTSMAEAGFWQLEPFVVLNDGASCTVLEGNRRLTAIRILLDRSLRDKYGFSNTQEPAVERVRSQTASIQCFVVKDRKDSWQMIGFKHINGPQRWDSVAKAQYVSELIKSGVPLSVVEQNLGDRNKTVARLARAYNVLEFAEKSKIWDRRFRAGGRFSFSHLSTGLDYPEIAKFIGLQENPTDESSPSVTKPKELGELLVFLYGDIRSNTMPVVRKQNPDLGKLRDTVASPQGLTILRNVWSLDEAEQASKGDSKVFREALYEAKRSIEVAKSKTAGGYDGNNADLETAVGLRISADDLVDSMAKRQRTAELRGSGQT